MDRVCHYHIPLFVNLDKRLREEGGSLTLLSGMPSREETGRVGIKNKIIDEQYKYSFKEWKIKRFTFRRWKGVTELVKKLRPDCIIMPSHVGNISSWHIQALGHVLGAKNIAWQCGYEYNDSSIKRLILRKYLARFDYHLAYHTNAKKYVETHGICANDVIVTHNTIDESAISVSEPDQARKIVHKKHPEFNGKKIILFVGAILKEKRVDLVIDALDIMARDDSVFVVIGDGPHLNDLQANYGHRNDVFFLGRIVTGVDVYFDAADVFVLTGTGGLAINEAMTHSLPIISSYADGSADDLVVHGINGYRLKSSSIEELTEYLSNILNNNDLRIEMGNESYRMITGEYSFSSFLNRVLSSVQKVCC